MEILDIIGFGASLCAKTVNIDGRYGCHSIRADRYGERKSGIYYGFRGGMEAFMRDSVYLVYDWPTPDAVYEFMTKKEFDEEYEIIEGE